MITRRMASKWVKFLGAALILVSTGCLDELDIDAPRNVQDGIVITARLIWSPGGSFISVELNRVFDFTGQSLQKIGAREVVLLNDSGESILVPELQAGVHQLNIDQNTPFSVDVGSSFQLSIATFDGRELISRPDQLQAVPEISAVSVRNVMKDGVDGLRENIRVPFLEFSVETPVVMAENQDEKSHLKWDFIRTYEVTDEGQLGVESKTCYISETPDPTRLSVEDGNRFADDIIKSVVYDEQITGRFSQGYYLTVIQQSLSAEAHEYWDAVSQSIERTGNLFEPPAGRIQTNFEEWSGDARPDDVFGFFYVTSQDLFNYYVSPEMAGNPVTFCPPPPTPPPPGGGCAFPICCDCLSVQGSSLSKPFFWQE